ncbi:MAG: tetratricopeptide repeat protein [Phycisphaerae bacterium]|nr:tetratricopeptide repeat protein [Phycisphaerae bacterium]
MSSILRRIASRSIVCCAALLAACAGHGHHTSEHMEQAQEKMTQLKSGVEWQQAQSQFLAGDLDKALKSVDASIALNPGVAKSHLLRGRILIEKGDLDRAREALAQSELLEAPPVESNYYLGIVNERMMKHEEALNRYGRAAELDPSNPQYVMAAAEMAVQLNQLDRAESILNATAGRFDHNAAVRQTQGHLFTLRGDHAKAVQCYSEAHLLAPDDISMLEDLARAQFAQGTYSEAEFSISKLLKHANGSSRRDLMHVQALCLVRTDRPVEARSVLQELTNGEDGTRDLRAWVQLGAVAASLDDEPRLSASGSRVIALAPTRPEGYMFRALALRKRGDLNGALRAVDNAVTRAGDDPSALVLRAMILDEMGRRDEARSSVEEALRRDPTSSTARQLLTELSLVTPAAAPVPVTQASELNK